MTVYSGKKCGALANKTLYIPQLHTENESTFKLTENECSEVCCVGFYNALKGNCLAKALDDISLEGHSRFVYGFILIMCYQATVAY